MHGLGGIDRKHAKIVSRLDSYDRSILRIIQEQGDIALGVLGTRVNLSASQCSRRLQRLKDEGFVARFAAILEPKRLDLPISAYVVVALESHSSEDEARFRKRILMIDEIVSADYLAGEADFMLKIVTRDLEAYSRLLSERLLPDSGIKSVKSSIILRSLKNTTELPLDYC